MIALLDYGAGNLRSVEKALRFVGGDVELVQSPDGMKDAAAVVLPGVGAFDDCVNAMQRQELLAASRGVYQNRPAVPRHLRRLSSDVRAERGVRQSRRRHGVV